MNKELIGVHSRLEFVGISKMVGIFGKGLIPFTYEGHKYKPSHYYINRPYYDSRNDKVDSGKILIERIES